jgi:hypothetical protein
MTIKHTLLFDSRAYLLQFQQKCWSIIKDDFHALERDLYDGSLNLQNISGSYITLVPMCNSPEGVNDYRPISLTNVCLKFLH